MNSIEDKIQGAFVGAALGDALGLPFERMPPRQVLEVTNRKGVTGFDHGIIRQAKDGRKLPPLSTSDDTQMFLCIAKSLIRSGGFNLLDQALAHVQELETCIDGWGSAHRQGLKEIKDFFDSRGQKGRNPFVPASYEEGKGGGNGVAMKILALLLWQEGDRFNNWSNNTKQLAQIAGLTHGDRRAWAAAAALQSLLFGKFSYKFIINCLPYFERQYTSHKQRRFSTFLIQSLDEDFSVLPIEQLAIKTKGGSIATQSVVLAIACILRNQSDLKRALLEVMNLGDIDIGPVDYDSIAAIVGGFVGYNVGFSNIPQEWQYILPQTQMLLNLSTQFYQALTRYHKQ